MARPLAQVAYAPKIDAAALDNFIRTGNLTDVPDAIHVLRQIQGEALRRTTAASAAQPMGGSLVPKTAGGVASDCIAGLVGGWRERPFDIRTDSVPRDEEVVRAVRCVLTGWDGVNWATVLAVLRRDSMSDESIRALTLMDLRMHFAVGQKAIQIKLGGIAQTESSSIATFDPVSADGTKPQYDCERRALIYRGQVVKTFKQKAERQETVLRAFEEEGWPTRIDDPLPPGKLGEAIRGRVSARRYDRSSACS